MIKYSRSNLLYCYNVGNLYSDHNDNGKRLPFILQMKREMVHAVLDVVGPESGASQLSDCGQLLSFVGVTFGGGKGRWINMFLVHEIDSCDLWGVWLSLHPTWQHTSQLHVNKPQKSTWFILLLDIELIVDLLYKSLNICVDYIHKKLCSKNIMYHCWRSIRAHMTTQASYSL